jgi:subtilase family serine protease
MNKLEIFAASVSALALMSATTASAAVLLPGAAGDARVRAQVKIARQPAQRDMNREREFYVLLKPGAAGAADAVQNYFRGFGFRTGYFANLNAIKLLGSFFQAERAGNFTYIAGRVPITPLRVSAKPSFPESVAGAIRATTFNRGPVMQSQATIAPAVPTTLPEHFGVYGLGPPDFAAIYGYNNLYKAGYNGAGETVDIIACYGYHASYLASFQTDFGLSPAPNVTAVNANLPIASPSGTGFEPDLDVQRVYGTAPGAAIRMWFSQECTFGDYANLFFDVANDQALHPAAAFNLSYGVSELFINNVSSYGSELFTIMDEGLSLITGGAAQKVALFVSSGDVGDNSVFDYLDPFNVPPVYTAPLGQADVEFPASDPNVLAVGATNLVLNGKFTREAEYAWSGSTSNNFGGSSGGISNIWPIPSWQKGVAGTFSQKYKNVPDVSSDGSPNSAGLAASQGGLVPVYGTSMAAPTWAGTVALLQQEYRAHHGGVARTNWPAYFYNPVTTALWFTDITNGVIGRFAAGPGYDNVTGLGVPCFLHFPFPCVNGK